MHSQWAAPLTRRMERHNALRRRTPRDPPILPSHRISSATAEGRARGVKPVSPYEFSSRARICRRSGCSLYAARGKQRSAPPLRPPSQPHRMVNRRSAPSVPSGTPRTTQPASHTQAVRFETDLTLVAGGGEHSTPVLLYLPAETVQAAQHAGSLSCGTPAVQDLKDERAGSFHSDAKGRLGTKSHPAGQVLLKQATVSTRNDESQGSPLQLADRLTRVTAENAELTSQRYSRILIPHALHAEQSCRGLLRDL